MKKKWKVIIVLSIVLFYAVGLTFYFSLKAYQDNLFYDSLFNDAVIFLENDLSFSEQYSKPVSIEKYGSPKEIESVASKVWRITCLVEVEDGNRYLVLVQIDYNDDIHSFVSVEKQ